MAHATLNHVRWAEDLAVSGDVSWNQADGAINAVLRYEGGAGQAGNITATWNDHDMVAMATLSGKTSAHTLAATMPAP
jgi:hypothetical protein